MRISLKNQVLFSEAKVADNILTRFKGLMLRKELKPNEALIITPCNSIHMFFMKMPLDILFVNNDNEIISVIKHIKPWRMTKIYWKADYVIECPIGTIDKFKLEVGQKLLLE